MNFSTEERKENDLITKAATGNIKTRTIRNVLCSLTLQAVDFGIHQFGNEFFLNRTSFQRKQAHPQWVNEKEKSRIEITLKLETIKNFVSSRSKK